MKASIFPLALILFLTSCATPNRGVRHEGLFYRGQVIKANGERKERVFIFGRDACVRKNERIRKRRARMNHPDRHSGYGITRMGNARQRR